MTDHTDLIARLRARTEHLPEAGVRVPDGLCLGAATALEALARENAELREAAGVIALDHAKLLVARAWKPIGSAPKDRRIEITDGARSVVAQHMTSMTDGNTAWVYARTFGEDGVSFEMHRPTHFRELGPLPAPPDGGEGG